mgnify:CR=1 FL=1
MTTKRNKIALEFVSKYGDKLTQQQRQILTNLGNGIVKENLNRTEVILHKNKMKSIMKYFAQS